VTSEQITVLVVDDRDANRYTTVHALTRAGYSVVEAATGKEALELAKNLPTVIVLDVKLPDILGYEVCRRIKANSRTKHIPILQLSAAFLTNESKLYALESGADAYLIQPADPMVLVATVRSLVRLHRAESQAQLAANQWQATFDALTEGVAIIDRAGVVTRCNHALTQLMGRPYGEIENSDFRDLVQDSFGLTLTRDGELPLQESKVGSRFFRLSLDQIVFQDERMGGIFIASETTEQKRAEEAILINERLAATGRMAHTIAHEINNPLEAITNLVYLLQSSLDQPETAKGYIDGAAKELARVSRISRQILSFNRESTSPVELRISDLIEDVLALNNRLLFGKRIQIIKEWDTSTVLQGFPAQLRQVFSNLLRNAVEASTDGGEIKIKISRSTIWDAVPTPAIRITFADHGLGISSEIRGRIFEAFFTTKDLKGSGVGLWLSSTIVHEHGGKLQVRSCTQPSRSGTCMSVVLPCDFLG
jgi:two-component system NtrC family sensor kinase